MKIYDLLYFILIFPLRQEYMHTVTFHMAAVNAVFNADRVNELHHGIGSGFPAVIDFCSAEYSCGSYQTVKPETAWLFFSRFTWQPLAVALCRQ